MGIGVVTGKFNLEELNEKIGYNTEAVSKGKYAELNTSSRAFEDFEYEYFKDGAQKAYESFRDKAAFSRNKSIESMEEVAQGRVWTGADAQGHKVVDYIGGMDKALSVAMELAEIPEKADHPCLISLEIQPLLCLISRLFIQHSKRCLVRQLASSMMPACLVSR